MPRPTASPAKPGSACRPSREDGRLVVSGVKRGTPGHEAGFNVGDEILAIGDYRVRPDGLSKRLEYYRPGETVSVLIARRDRLMRLDATLGQEPPNPGDWSPTPRPPTPRRPTARPGWGSDPQRPWSFPGSTRHSRGRARLHAEPPIPTARPWASPSRELTWE